MVNIKKTLLKIRYLEEEYSDCLDIFNKAKVEIAGVIRQTHSDLNVFDKDIDSKFCQVKHLEDSDDSDRIDPPRWAKKLFRKIVMITHPDKIPDTLSESVRDKFLEMYQKSKVSIDDGDYVSLIMIASDLNIDLSSSKIDDQKMFDDKQREIEKKISEIKRSVEWIWFYSSGEKRGEILREFINQRGWTSKESGRKKSRGGPGNHPGKSLSWARSKINIVNKEDN
jgi:hypothetical protein